MYIVEKHENILLDFIFPQKWMYKKWMYSKLLIYWHMFSD